MAIATCVALGVLLAILPFILEYRGMLKVIEVSAVGSAVEKIRNLETIATQVNSVSNLWQSAQDQADKTAATAKEIFERMQSELHEFKAFVQKANDTEKATLRLEVEKLRRGEAEWLQILVRVLDHIFALHTAASRSGQQQVIAQLSRFQEACRDAARRIGLVPFVAAHSEPFDTQRHKWADGEKPAADAVIAETLATGYTFQGKLLRPALVRVQQNGAVRKDEMTGSVGRSNQSQLPLEATETTMASVK
jgi:molecular chaperone GrpE (heat shock protein)